MYVLTGEYNTKSVYSAHSF